MTMSDPEPGWTLADHAHNYAEHGLHIFPVIPTGPDAKQPHVSQYKATTDPFVINEWWNRWPNALIGHRLPEDVIVLDVDPRHGGYDTWKALKETLPAHPLTRYHRSGRGDGGGHLWFQRPSDKLTTRHLDAWAKERGHGHPILLKDGTDTGRWVSGIDILQHEHRYTILPPSPHPDTGQPYEWKIGLEQDPAIMPAVLADLLTDDTPPAPPSVPKDPDPNSIADWYTDQANWNDILGRHGWTIRAGDGHTDGSRWRHPRATSAFSATIRHGCLFVYSPNTPFEVTSPSDPHGYTPFKAYAVLEHSGDLSAAARAARELRDGPTGPNVVDDLSWIGEQAPAQPPGPSKTPSGAPAAAADDDETPDSVPGSTWTPTPLKGLLDGIANGTLTRAQPTIGQYADSELALYYPGRINGLYGESGKGKSWIALALTAETLADGGTVAWIDLEEPAEGVLTRLLELGVDPNVIAERFLHFAPEESINVGAQLYHALDKQPPTLAVIDSTGEALALEGAGPNQDDEVANWFRKWPRRLATRYGAAVLVIDHVVKDETTRGLWAGGSQRKRAAITGSAFMVTDAVTLGRGTEGRLKLTTAKDRQGNHRQGKRAADFVLDARTVPYRWKLETPAGTDGKPFRPTGYMEKVSRHLEQMGDWQTFKDVNRMVPGKQEHIRKALSALVEDGYVELRQEGQKHLHRSIRPFAEDTEWISDV